MNDTQPLFIIVDHTSCGFDCYLVDWRPGKHDYSPIMTRDRDKAGRFIQDDATQHLAWMQELHVGTPWYAKGDKLEMIPA